jgi:ubiquinone biosynthesis protein Coq4
MKSPELHPELTEGLLTSLAEWSPFATVPLAHLFMKLGDEDARRGYDEMVLTHPLAQQMLEERTLSPVPDLEALAALPEGSLGRAFETYMTENDLDPVLLRESAFIEAHKKRGEDVGYLAERGFQLHDMFHVLTGFDTSPLGEVRVVSFTVAQTPAPYPALIVASRPLQAALYKPQLLPPIMDAITEGWALGRRARPLITVHWEDFWERPLTELRREYRLAS